MPNSRNDIITALGTTLEDAVRTSVAKGAQYQPGENISTDTTTVWRSVAETLVTMVEIMIREKGLAPKPGSTDVTGLSQGV